MTNKLRLALCCAGLFQIAASGYAADLPPSVPPPKAIHLPAPAIRVLPNGLKVAVIERHSLPILTLRLVIESGAEADPPNLPGTAQLVASLLNQGTAQRSAQEIARTLDHVGGTIDTGADFDDSFVALSVLTDHTELAFDLVADMVVRPAFAPGEIERQRKQALSALEVAQNDPAYVADTVFTRLIYAGTPYSHPADGTPDGIHRITAENIHEFYLRNYRPSNSILAVVGDIGPDRAFALAAQYFSVWHESAAGGTGFQAVPATSGATAPSPTTPDPMEADEARRVLVIDKPDAVQTEIRVGNRGLPRASPDYLALTVANQILGGPATNRLYKALRIEHGLTYNASSELECNKSVGGWTSKTSTRTTETLKGVHVMLEEMKRLRDHSISDYELHTAQSYLTGHLALDTESSGELATQMLILMVYNLPLDYWDRFPQRLSELEADDVLNATRRYLDVERNVIVLVGNAASFSRELKKLGDFRIIPIHDLDFASPNLVRPGATEHR
jgi:zinc protease